MTEETYVLDVISLKKLLKEHDNGVIFHFVDENKLENILTKNQIKPRWKHYIETENRMVTGTSFTWIQSHSIVLNMGYKIQLLCDRKQLEIDYKTFLINGERTHLQTLTMTSDFDPTAYKLEDTTPDELFVEGIINPLSKYLLDIKVLSPISKKSENLMKTFQKTLKIIENPLWKFHYPF